MLQFLNLIKESPLVPIRKSTYWLNTGDEQIKGCTNSGMKELWGHSWGVGQDWMWLFYTRSVDLISHQWGCRRTQWGCSGWVEEAPFSWCLPGRRSLPRGEGHKTSPCPFSQGPGGQQWSLSPSAQCVASPCCCSPTLCSAISDSSNHGNRWWWWLTKEFVN